MFQSTKGNNHPQVFFPMVDGEVQFVEGTDAALGEGSSKPTLFTGCLHY